MVFTRSQLKNMSITSEMREYFENLMKPLVTNETLEHSHKKRKDSLETRAVFSSILILT